MILRIFIDAPAENSGAGVTVDDCARVSHAVSQVLETQDPIKGHYTLEVSSPGFDRILRTRGHFERFVGERIFAELKLPIDGRRRYVGVLKSVGGRHDCDGSRRQGAQPASRADSEGEIAARIAASSDQERKGQ